MEPTVRTGAPVTSVTRMSIPPSAAVAIRTRTAAAPTACRATRFHANGMTVPPLPSSALSLLSLLSLRIATCMAASSSAGWRPKRPASEAASSGSATSAKSSPPRRQAARSPWKTGP